jgi:hypothetical protein
MSWRRLSAELRVKGRENVAEWVLRQVPGLCICLGLDKSHLYPGSQRTGAGWSNGTRVSRDDSDHVATRPIVMTSFQQPAWAGPEQGR